jgi:transcriptional regulator with XRE-family HTH domain
MSKCVVCFNEICSCKFKKTAPNIEETAHFQQKKLGELLRARRHSLKFTLSTLSERSGVPLTSISELESANQGWRPKPRKVLAVARALDLDINLVTLILTNIYESYHKENVAEIESAATDIKKGVFTCKR